MRVYYLGYHIYRTTSPTPMLRHHTHGFPLTCQYCSSLFIDGLGPRSETQLHRRDPLSLESPNARPLHVPSK